MSSSPPLVVADRYRLVAPLGQGGMGRVWRATDVVLHRDVAIKELVPPPGLTAGERQEMRERSLREARAIARLNNVNVVRVFDVLRTDADPWIVMEYVASRSLHDTLASDGPFHPVRAAEIGLGVLGALRAAHRAGVVHRDVKPGNVLLGADGRVVLTDFGLATVPGDPNVTRTGLVLGSPAYIAPERARDGTAGPAADLWSLGATLYAAVEGSSPFARPSAIATLAALATENPPPSRNAGPLKPVLNGLLRKDPAHRINAEEAERLLLRATGRRSKLTFPMSPTMRRPGVGRERPALPPTGATPVVPGPRPPVAPSRPAQPMGQAPAAGGRPVFAPGKAPVGRPADKPTRVDGPKVDASRLDPTRVDGPPVRDGRPPFGTRQAPPPPADPSARPGGPVPHEVDPALARTVRGGPDGFTAADVAANRRKKLAPEHERSLADAAAMASVADATTVVPPAADKPRSTGKPTPADATTVVPPATGQSRTGRTTSPPADATTVVPAPGGRNRRPAVSAPGADATTVVPSPARRPSPPADATTVVPRPGRDAGSPPDATTVVPLPARRAPLPADATPVVPPAERATPAVDEAAAGRSAVDAPRADAATVVPRPETLEELTSRPADVEPDGAATTESGNEAGSPAAAVTGAAESGSAAGSGAAAVTGAAESGSAAGSAAAAVTGAAESGSAANSAAGATKPVPAGSTAATKRQRRTKSRTASAVEGAGEDGSQVDEAFRERAGGDSADDSAGAAATDDAPAPVDEPGTASAPPSDPGTAGSKESDPGTGGSPATASDPITRYTTSSAAASAATVTSDAPGSGTAGSGTAGSGAAEPGTTRSDNADSATPHAGPAGSGSAGSGSAGSESGEGPAGSGTVELDEAGAGAAELGATASGAPGSGVAGSGSAARDLARPGMAESGTAGSGAAGSGSGELDSAQSGVAGSGAAGSDLVGSGLAGSGSAGAEAAERDPTGFGTAAPERAGSEAGGLDAAGPEPAARPDASSPDTTGPAAEPGTTGSGIDDRLQSAAAGSSARDSADQAPDHGEAANTVGAEPASDGADADEDADQSDRVAGGAVADGAAQVVLPLARKPRREATRGRPAAVPSDLPPFSPAARPAWTPMQVRPTVRQTAGITVFGTRLTYRQAAIGAAALLVVLLLVIVLAAKAFSGGDRDKAASPGSARTTAPAAGAPATSHAPSGAPSSPSSSAPTSRPTSASPATGGAVTLPAGWRWYTKPTQSNWPGFTIPIPQNATFSFDGSQVFIRWNNRLLLVDRTSTPNPDPVQDWKDLEGHLDYRDYHRIKIVPVNYFKGGADWEFMYTTDNGNVQHVDKRNIEVSAAAAYSLNWYTSPEDWAAGQSDIQLIYRGFQPKP